MKLNVYTIFDTASGVYARPFFMQADGQATRAFKDIATDADHEIGKHPEDYSLHRIGIFDDNNGKIIPEEKECLATALELVALSRNVDKPQMKALQDFVNGKDPDDLKPGGTI